MNNWSATRSRSLLVLALVLVLIASDAFPVTLFQQKNNKVEIIARSRNRLWSTGGKVPDGPDEEAITTTPVVRDTELGRMALGIARTGMKDLEALQVGDVVVAKCQLPSLNIWANSGYEIIELYCQGVNAETGLVEQIPLATFSDGVSKSGYSRYMKVYSPRYHTAPVVVTPEEIGLVTLKAELFEAMLLAIPGFFWVFVASAFASNYNDKYGGNFFDAFFRT
mmetsp:Transcript_6322/g.18199  ORF Transcript_6322/g.18199 Transcript_6322/m.18199 type:complete len:223 (-) Transcript_6322:112-780(-)